MVLGASISHVRLAVLAVVIGVDFDQMIVRKRSARRYSGSKSQNEKSMGIQPIADCKVIKFVSVGTWAPPIR
jgi:hypothetical protein